MEKNRELANRIKDWLQKETHDAQSASEGVELLRQVIPNRLGLINTLSRHPDRPKSIEKVKYELGKHVKYLVDNLDLRDVKAMEAELVPQVRQELAKDALGKRTDHDQLPEDIRRQWDDASELWKKIKTLYQTCKDLPAPCDRYESLKTLKEAWYKYKALLKSYDEYVINTDKNAPAVTASPGEDAKEAPSAESKEVTNARAYISKNLQRLIDLQKSNEPEDLADSSTWYERLKERVDILVAANAPMTDEMRQRLQGVGLLPSDEAAPATE